MTKIKIDACRTASGTLGRLRGALTSQEITTMVAETEERVSNRQYLTSKTRQGARHGQVPQRALEDNVR